MSRPMQLEIGARDFAALVAPVMPCAGTNVMLPVLNTVRFEVRRGYLLAMATDRFRLAIHRQETDCVPFDAVVRLDDLRHILRFFKPQRAMEPTLRLTVASDDDGKPVLRVEQTGGLAGFDFLDGSVTYRLESGQFPRLFEIFEEPLKATTASWFNVDAVYLADWRHASTSGTKGIQLRASEPNRPVIVSAGRDFIGAQMPLRVGDQEENDLSHWIEFFQPVKPPAKKRAAKKASAL